jgi:hypothetical protein
MAGGRVPPQPAGVCRQLHPGDDKASRDMEARDRSLALTLNSQLKSVSHIRSEICEAFDRPSGW